MSVLLAKNSAENIVAKYGVSKPPVPVEKIAEKEGLRILYEELDSGVSGLLITKKGKSYCCIRESDPETRQRFTIGHELGHLLLQHQYEDGDHVHINKGNYISQRGPRASEGVDPKEIEANQFSASLLMPSSLLKKEIAKHKDRLTDVIVSDLAELFKVSEQAMTIRLISLGLL